VNWIRLILKRKIIPVNLLVFLILSGNQSCSKPQFGSILSGLDINFDREVLNDSLKYKYMKNISNYHITHS